MATVYRTTSESNVLSNYSSSPLSHCTTILPQNSSRSVPSTPLINNHSSSPPGSDHHLPPQDYVVVTGQKYKLRKTLRDEYKCSDGSSIGDHTRIVMLTKALEEAHKTIESQALELKKQEEYILQLEQQLVDSSNNTTTLHLLSRPRGGSHPTPPVMNSIQPIPSNRKKNRLQEAIQSTKIINCDDELDQLFDGPTTPSIDSSSKMNISPIEIQTIQPKFPDPSLYIAHDNPQLGKIVLDSFTKESTAAMSVMIETKDSEGFLRIILGEILYSGDSEAITSTLHQQVDTRGGQCLVCVNMTGYIFQLSTVERRVLTKTTDINLSPSSIINSIKFVNQSQLREFFNHCPARVDIILAPFHEGVWYPYWENSENDEGNSVNHTANIRKLAPQFRSSGIGYLRLGDDMSSYGTSFLSCDSMLTYFDNQQPSSTSSMTIQDHADVPISEDIDFLLGSLIDKISQSTKWSDRCQHLKAIADLLRNTSVSDLQLIDGRFYSLMTVLTKELSQSNLQVLKEALSCVDDFMNCWRNYTPWGEHIRTPHLTPSELTLLLVSLIQLLRHSNRAIITSSMELLRKWFEMDASDSPDKLKLTHGARFLVLVSLHFQEAVKAKPTGIDLLLHWFVEILTLTGQRWCQFRTTSALLFILESSERQEELISRFIQMLSPLLRHKDEKTRDASLLALGHVCSLDLFWYRHVSNPTASPSLVTIPNSFSELLDQLPPVTAQYMREISTDSSWKRSEGKFLQAVNSFMRKLETL